MKKPVMIYLAACMLLASLTACGSASPVENQLSDVSGAEIAEQIALRNAADAGDGVPEAKNLIVYFSRWGNTEYPDDVDATSSASIVVSDEERQGITEYIACFIQEYAGGDLHLIQTTEPYPADFSVLRAQNTQEMDDGFMPKLTESNLELSAYDTVFIGYPIWAMDAPQAIFSFLSEYDLTGKTIVPFCTHHRYGSGRSYQHIAEAVPGAAAILDGFDIDSDKLENAEEETAEWLRSIGLGGQTVHEIPYTTDAGETGYHSLFPRHEPYGTGVGAMPGRVVWAYDPDSVEWDGSGWWWEIDHFDETVIQRMVNDSITSLGGQDTAAKSWNAPFTAHNISHGRGEHGYQSGEKIAIKANINGSGLNSDDASGETEMSYTNPVLMKALLVSLVKEGGGTGSGHTVYDVSRIFPDYMVEMCTQGDLSGIRFVGRTNGVADESAPINWSYDVGGDTNYLPACVTEAAYVINLANLKGHSYGMTLCGKNHFGSYFNSNRMRPPVGANLHGFLAGAEMDE